MILFLAGFYFRICRAHFLRPHRWKANEAEHIRIWQQNTQFYIDIFYQFCSCVFSLLFRRIVFIFTNDLGVNKQPVYLGKINAHGFRRWIRNFVGVVSFGLSFFNRIIEMQGGKRASERLLEMRFRHYWAGLNEYWQLAIPNKVAISAGVGGLDVLKQWSCIHVRPNDW